MYYFFDKWDKLRDDLRGKRLFIFLDYDGTLTPIRNTPAEAVIPADAVDILKRIAKGPSKVAIVSGRSLKDIKKIIGVRGIIYAGNHGLEIEGPKMAFKYPAAPAYVDALERIKKELTDRLSGIKGALVEDKGLTLSAHYRLVKAKEELLVKTIVHNSIRPYILKKIVCMAFGKKVFEIRPPVKWDKGKAVMWLLAHSTTLRAKPEQTKRVEGLAKSHYDMKGGFAPIYIGDDVTDEDAFDVLKKRGVTIFAGKAQLSKAKYYLNNHKEVIRFLKMAAELGEKEDARAHKSKRTV